MDIIYQRASKDDAGIIAGLHTRSWQRHYRGIYSDDYLDNLLAGERSAIWTERFAVIDPSMFVLKAMHAEKPIGFACTFLHRDQQFGALVDNLHVLQEYQGLGIGRELLRQSAEWVKSNDQNSGIYLFVLKENLLARQFYQSLDTTFSEIMQYTNSQGDIDEILKCSWNTDVLLAKTRPRENST
jgi:ribosomal protein S18 acetylase RimI-like enzyme